MLPPVCCRRVPGRRSENLDTKFENHGCNVSKIWVNRTLIFFCSSHVLTLRTTLWANNVVSVGDGNNAGHPGKADSFGAAGTGIPFGTGTRDAGIKISAIGRCLWNWEAIVQQCTPRTGRRLRPDSAVKWLRRVFGSTSCIYYLSSCHKTAPDANCWTIRSCLLVSKDPTFLWISSNSCSLNLLFVRNHHAEIIIVKRLIQGHSWTQAIASGGSNYSREDVKIFWTLFQDVYAELHSYEQLVMKVSAADAQKRGEMEVQLEEGLPRIRQLASSVKKQAAWGSCLFISLCNIGKLILVLSTAPLCSLSCFNKGLRVICYDQ